MSLTMDDYVVGLSVGSLNRSNHLLLRAGSNGTPTTSTIHTSTSNSALKKTAERYLSTTAMRATENSMALVSSVLGFEIVEIWTESEAGKLHCTYVHAEESVTEKYPDIICGHFPEHKKEHILSPKLCELAKASSNRCHWRIIENRVYSPSTAGTVYDQLKFPLRTEMAYQLEHENNKSSPLAFIVALSFEKIQYKPYKLKFLSGLAVAIFVAAFDLEEEDKQVERRMSIQNEQELDNKEFLPVHSHSSVNLAAMANAPTTVSVMGNVTKNHSSVSVPALNLSALTLGLNASVGSLVPTLDFSKLTDISTRKPTLTGADVMVNARRSRTNTANSDSISAMMNMKGNASSPGLASSLVPALALPEMYPLNDSGANRAKANSVGSQHSIGLDLSQSDGKLSPATSARAMVSPRALELPPLEPALTVATPRDVLDDVIPTPRSMISVASRPDLTSTNAVVPAWEPATSFSYPIFQIPIKHSLQNDLTMESFSDVKHIADGSNSNIFLAKFNGVRAIIKMIKQQAENDSIAIQEFDLEYGTLARLAHPHIIRILGAGNLPRRFIVLEWLGGGTLQTVLAENQQSVGLAQKFFRKPTFTYTSLLQNAKHIAEALEYLHHRCHPGATIIHRDLKPDNVGYTKDGQLKLFDFGLVTCVKARQKSDEAYEMTGYTGSLRYMAPEVVLRKPYSEKADVYSFGIMLWQMASDKVPFKGFSKEEFIDQVVYQGLRPKLDKSWPTALNTLLKRCWEEDPVARPSFTIIVLELNKLLAQENQHGSNPLKSSWF